MHCTLLLSHQQHVTSAEEYGESVSCPWARYLTFLCLSFVTSTTGMIILNSKALFFSSSFCTFCIFFQCDCVSFLFGSFSQLTCLMSAYNMPGTILVAGHRAQRQDQWVPQELTSPWGGRQYKKQTYKCIMFCRVVSVKKT